MLGALLELVGQHATARSVLASSVTSICWHLLGDIKIFENTQKNMGLIIDLVPWVLTHQDLSSMKLAEESHRLEGTC